jgi:hypothetical protein
MQVRHSTGKRVLRSRWKSKGARWPNDYFAPHCLSEKFRFSCCLRCGFLCKIAGNQGWKARAPDITPGSAVQNILKKMKKRLVSPLKPR